jgi:hypothetical protein
MSRKRYMAEQISVLLREADFEGKFQWLNLLKAETRGILTRHRILFISENRKLSTIIDPICKLRFHYRI